MVDHLTPQERSELMRRVQRNGTAPEQAVRKVLRALGYRGRQNVSSLPGSPDIAIVEHSVVIFVHGCFWHRHAGCKSATTPKSRRPFWLAKFKANVARDKLKAGQLRKLGWRVITIWGCQTKDVDKLRVMVARRLAARRDTQLRR